MNWAVGFGPTQYADYKKGQSVLPIDVLTDADRKWMKTAELGGTGGLEIMTGMVVEEPGELRDWWTRHGYANT